MSELEQFDMAYRRSTVALEAVRLNVINCEEAGLVVKAFIGVVEEQKRS